MRALTVLSLGMLMFRSIKKIIDVEQIKNDVHTASVHDLVRCSSGRSRKVENFAVHCEA